MTFVMGVDLGQAQDYTAVAVVERIARREATEQDAGTTSSGTGARTTHRAHSAARTEYRYHLRHLERPPLGTLYPDVVARVQALLGTPALGPRGATALVVDKTGVGAAVVDMFRAAGLAPQAITITGGDTVIRDSPRHTKVPKRDLVGHLVALFQSGRFKMASSLDLAPLLVNELLTFKVKVNLQTGHDSYAAWRDSDHDDLVLATALACWHAAHARMTGVRVWQVAEPSREAPRGAGPTAQDYYQAQRTSGTWR